MMDSSSAQPLKSKLSHIKLLLDDASHRLRDEADIFTTKTSASAAMKPNQNGHTRHLSPNELRRTIADISTVQSVLSCPIFNQIANVTDSLDKLTYHLNLRPSIGPADIEFNDNGELVLAPPVEPTSLNNLINSQLDEYSNLPNSPQLQNNQIVTNSTMGAAVVPTVAGSLAAQNGNNIEHQFNAQHQQQNASNYYTEFTKFHAQQQNNEMMSSSSGEASRGDKSLSDTLPCDQQNYIAANHPPPPPPVSSSAATAVPSQPQSSTATTTQQRRSDYNTEKLLGADAVASSGGQPQATTNYANGARRPTKVQSVAAVFESAIAAGEANRGLHKANGHAALNQTTAQPNSADIRMDFETTRSMSQINEQSMSSDSSQTLGYTNEMYKAAHEIASAGNLDSNFKSGVYANGAAQQPTNGKPAGANVSIGGRVAQNGKVLVSQPLSPATSAGSNAKLIDECDSGTSSFRSKGALYSPQPQKLMEQQADEDPIDSSIDQELIEKLSPEMERIKVTLEKDTSGLGITIAGYTCEQEEISGIFIKSITPGSPADRSGKIRILDQIFAVNGQEILGYSNPDAVNVLRRQTSKIVTLDLMRYLAESKYKKLQTLLEHAEPSANLQQKSQMMNSSSDAIQPAKAQPVVSTSSPKQVEQPQQPRQQQQQPVESMYNNTSAFISQKPQDGATSPIPVAAQRAAPTSKVIETKQGARNKVDIRSPLVQTTAMATYVNAAESALAAANNSSSAGQNNPTSVPDRLRQEFQFSEEFCQLEKLEWAKNVEIVELRRESTQSLGFTIKDYANPKDSQQSIFMIVSITPGSIADQSGRLSIGDLLMFVDDTPLENSSLSDAVKALRRTSGQVRLGILKYMRN